MSAIEFDNVRFTYDGERNALDGVSLSVEEGEFVCVLGGNGSGKSTLAKHVNALLVPDSGTVRVHGCDTRDEGSVYSIRGDVGLVFQNPDDQIVASIVEDDVAFGPENLGVPAPELRERVEESLRQVGLAGFGKREVATLSGGEKQRVAIAGALAMRPKVLVLDEASAMLDPESRDDLMRLYLELNATGLTIVCITHFMDEAARADRVIALAAGRLATEAEAAALDVPLPERPARGNVAGDPVLRVEGVSFSYGGTLGKPMDGGFSAGTPSGMSANPGGAGALEGVPAGSDRPGSAVRRWALRDVSLEVRGGEFLGISGRSGSGKSTLVQLMTGLVRPTSGRVVFGEADLADKRAARSAHGSIGVVFQYPERQLFAPTVAEDVAFGPRNLGLDAAEVERRVARSLELVGLDPAAVRERSPFALSGGQQRRVAIAGVLAMEPEVLVLDEPTASLDPGGRASLLSLVAELCDARGLTVVLVSHDHDALEALCDRVAVLDGGRLAVLDAPEAALSHVNMQGRHGR